MNYEKYEEIKKKYCVETTNINFSAMTNDNPIQIQGDNLTYNYNNGVVSFIDENGISYVTPFYEIIKTLENAGYKQDGLYVPFSDNKWLNEGVNAWKWKNLIAQEIKNRIENTNLSDDFNIEETLENTMHM